jgi:hypothetical protein
MREYKESLNIFNGRHSSELQYVKDIEYFGYEF